MSDKKLLSIGQASAHIRALKHQEGYLFTHLHGYWRNPIGTGYCNDTASALKASIEELLAIYGVGNNTFIELVDQELAEKILGKKCNADNVLGRDLVRLLTSSPLNPTLRAQVMAISGQMPPPELDTCDKIKDWLETIDVSANKIPCDVPINPPPQLSIMVTHSRPVSGTCRFASREVARTEYSAESTVDQYIQSTDGPLNLTGLNSLIRDRARANPVQGGDSFEYDGENENLEDYETTSIGEVDTRVHFSSDETRQQLINYIRQRYPRDIQRRFNI